MSRSGTGRRAVLAPLVGVLLAALPACRSSGGGAGTSAGIASARAAATRVADAAPALPLPHGAAGMFATAHLVRCGWGDIKAEPGAHVLPWAIALVDVELRHELKGLHVASLELGAGGDVVASMGSQATIRVQDSGASYSFAAEGTHDLGPSVSAGTWRLRVAVALDRASKSIAPRKPSRCAVVLSDENGEHLIATGNLDAEWTND